jgi:hypothetical protein
MEKEIFISGYCRVLDQSRMVELITDDGELLEVDCCYGSCIHEPNCQIAKQIREQLNP